MSKTSKLTSFFKKLSFTSSTSNSTTSSKSTASNSAQNEAVSILEEEIETNIQPQLLYTTISDDPAYAVSEFNQGSDQF